MRPILVVALSLLLLSPLALPAAGATGGCSTPPLLSRVNPASAIYCALVYGYFCPVPGVCLLPMLPTLG